MHGPSLIPLGCLGATSLVVGLVILGLRGWLTGLLPLGLAAILPAFLVINRSRPYRELRLRAQPTDPDYPANGSSCRPQPPSLR